MDWAPEEKAMKQAPTKRKNSFITLQR